MIKVASISEINSDFIKLRLNSDSHCIDCKSRCSDGFLDFLFHKKNKKDLLISRQNNNKPNEIIDVDGFFNEDKKIGESVGVQFSDRYLMLLSVILYAVPIVLIMSLLPLAYLLGSKLSINPDLCGFIGFIIALILSKLLIYNFRAKLKIKVDFF